MSQPGLTAEEWASALLSSAGIPAIAARIADERRGVAAPGTPERLAVFHHALAALALYGTPHGFTWDDVDTLLVAVDELTYTNDLQYDLKDLADRISALLPPRDVP